MFAFFMTIPELLFDNGVVNRVTELTEEVNVVGGWRIGADKVLKD